MNEKKLIIEKPDEKMDEIGVRISRKANALVLDIANRSGRNKSYIISRMIEFAFDFVEIPDDDGEE